MKCKLPFCDHYLITTFFRPPIRKERTSLHPPILRPEILAAKPSRGDHLLVYQTADGNDALADALRPAAWSAASTACAATSRRTRSTATCAYRPFSETTFIDDLATCRAVIAGGGFTLMGEAVYLHKPMLAVPLAGQFEQILNGRYLEREGYGMTVEDPGQVELLRPSSSASTGWRRSSPAITRTATASCSGPWTASWPAGRSGSRSLAARQAAPPSRPLGGAIGLRAAAARGR